MTQIALAAVLYVWLAMFLAVAIWTGIAVLVWVIFGLATLFTVWQFTA